MSQLYVCSKFSDFLYLCVSILFLFNKVSSFFLLYFGVSNLFLLNQVSNFLFFFNFSVSILFLFNLVSKIFVFLILFWCLNLFLLKQMFLNF